MGIPLLEGRAFAETDNQDSENVVIIDEWLARRYWPESSPIGKRMLRGVPGMEDEEENFYTVIGVVGQIRQNDLTATEHTGAYYHSYKQNTMAYITLVVKTQIEPSSLTTGIRESIALIDPDLPFYGIETMESRISESLLQFRTPMMLLIVFAGVALFLAAIGIYGVLAYSITQRTRELGIMIALGSSSQHIFRTIVKQGLIVLGVGLAIGIGSTLLLVQLIQALLFGVQPTDPVIFTAVSLLLALVVIVACILPARRATQIDPVATLNFE
jgi:ABC-type antimicrobial peptide transport system permease subunit